jgi:hypothetical protein
LLESITENADGTSLASAYHVISVLEEQAVLKSKNLTLLDRRLAVEQQEPYDVLTVQDEAGSPADLYFQIRPIIVHLYRASVPGRGFGFNQLGRGGPLGLLVVLLLAGGAGLLHHRFPEPVARTYRAVQGALFARRRAAPQAAIG